MLLRVILPRMWEGVSDPFGYSKLCYFWPNSFNVQNFSFLNLHKKNHNSWRQGHVKEILFCGTFSKAETVFILCANIYFLKGFFSFSLLFTALVTRRRATPMAPSVAAPVRCLSGGMMKHYYGLPALIWTCGCIEEHQLVKVEARRCLHRVLCKWQLNKRSNCNL